ncbi:MAG TPA: type VI secretion system baseplate subunit TssG, partial [Gemmatales bacterium]|nr:type VI secretion system baseplate subunit TssG [Gemmatales bacterium]
YDYEVQLVLDRHTVPAARLDSSSPLGVRLGWNSWLVERTPDEDPGDAVFQGEEVHTLVM